MNELSISPEEVLSVIEYNSVTGSFFWKWRVGDRKKFQTWNTRFAGKPCASISKDGYLRIRIGEKTYPAHRLAWLIYYRESPDAIIDHINRDRFDNRIVNLRLVTHSENMQNRKLQINNKSGFRGVSWDSKYGKWRARINSQGKCINLGYHDTAEKASKAFELARSIYHTV